MKIFTLGSILILALCSLSGAGPSEPTRIQLALLLDTSNSMDGLIDQARARLWEVVNELARARKGESRPQLEVALYEYGKSSLAAEKGYLQKLVPFTTDLDRISEALFALTTNGGDEYCGMVIQAAGNELAWSHGKGDYKTIFIAGNEAFSQGPVDFRKACQETISRGIMVNTLFCGSQGQGDATLWKEGAEIADGRFMAIDQNQVLTHVTAPQDKRILELSNQLNTTFVAYGPKGKDAAKRQKKEDANASGISEEVAVQRTFAKAAMAPQTRDWDLVSAVESGAMADEALAEAELDEAEPMARMEVKERKEYLSRKAAERNKIQEELQQLNKDRSQWLAGQHKETGTLGHALKQAVRKQLEEKAFKIEDQ